MNLFGSTATKIYDYHSFHFVLYVPSFMALSRILFNSLFRPIFSLDILLWKIEIIDFHWSDFSTKHHIFQVTSME